MLFGRVVSLLSVLLLTTASTTNADCAPRVRRAWTALNVTERQLYKDAIAAAMDSGAYIKFVEVHTEMMSEKEAHRQCMFVYWHRFLLTAFENMLRGQGAKFACVTIPYWDWITDYSNFATGTCSNLLECSPTLSFLGGNASISRGWRSVNINGETIAGYCQADPPLNHFCHSSKVSGNGCAKCVPRQDWTQMKIPASASFASVRAQLFGATNIGKMSPAIEQGVHNNMHAVMGSTMATFESPSDPVFWSHHAMIDALHSIFHKCKVGEQKLTFVQKATGVDWSSCMRRDGTRPFQPTDYLTMRTGYTGQSPINATQDAIVGKYFAAVPQQFAALVDIRDIGTSSYSYELQGLLGSLYTGCGTDNTTTPIRPSQEEVEAGEERPTGASSTKATNSTAQTPPTMGSILNTTTDPAAQTVRQWICSTDKLVERRGGNAVFEAEKMACLFQDQCLGGVTSYTPEFKKRFGIKGEPRCKEIVDRIYRRDDAAKITEWKAQMVHTFGCPTPKTQERLKQV